MDMPIFNDDVTDVESDQFIREGELQARLHDLESEVRDLKQSLFLAKEIILSIDPEYFSRKSKPWKDMSTEEKLERNKEVKIKSQISNVEAINQPDGDVLKELATQEAAERSHGFAENIATLWGSIITQHQIEIDYAAVRAGNMSEDEFKQKWKK